VTYVFVLYCHSYVRWVVLALGVAVVVLHGSAWAGARPPSRLGERLYTAFVGAVDVQLLLGLLLFLVLSPISSAFFRDPAHAVHEHTLRFFGLEHAVTMTAAVVAVHVGRRRAKKAPSPPLRARRATTSALVALALIAAAIPWPGLRHGRPLFRTPEPSTANTTSPARAENFCPPVFAERCVACHGAQGGGDGIAAAALDPRPRNFRDPRWGRGRTDADLAAIIRGGGAARGLSVGMPAQPDLSPPQIDALVQCVRRLHAAGVE